MNMDPSDTSLLTSIRVVCRSQPEIYALDHVVYRIDALIFPSDRLTLSKCVEYNNIRLFTRVLKSLENDKTLCKFEKLQQFRLAMNTAATIGQLWMVKRLYNRHPAALNGTTAFLVGKSGNLEMLQWVYEEKKHLMSVNSYAAAYKAFECSHGELNTVQWLVKTFPNATFDVSIPAKQGHLEVVKWVVEQGKYRCNENVTDEVAIRGDLEMMQFLLKHKLLTGQSSAPDLAAEFGHLDLVKWLGENKAKHSWQFSTDAMDRAAGEGHLEVVQWLHENEKVGCTTGAMDLAARSGHLNVLEWLHSNRREGCTENAMNCAAMMGYLEVLQWLHVSETAGCTTSAICLAAYKGHLDVLRWLYKLRDGDCTKLAMDWAAKAGHIEVVKWLHYQGQSCTVLAMDQAAANGHLDMVKFLHMNRDEGCTSYALKASVGNGDLSMVRWLLAHRNEGVVSEAMNLAAERGYLEVVKCLLASSADACSSQALDTAATNGHLAIVQWLHENSDRQCSPVAMIGAAVNCHVKVTKWLYEVYAWKIPPYAMMESFATGDFEMLKFLLHTKQLERYSVASGRAIAAKNHQVEVMQWLTENYSEVR